MGAEVGIRTELVPQLQSSLDFWVLDLDSELIWDADKGTNTASAPTRRLGVEWANSYQPFRWLFVDLNVAFSQATFRQNDPTSGELAGQPVPEAVRWTVAAGASIRRLGPWSAGLFWRYFGPRIICTEGSCGGSGGAANGTPIWSRSSGLLNGQVSYELTRNVKVSLEGLNLLNSKVDDIAYYYQTRQSWESQASWGYEVHPSEPFELRGTVVVQF
jgi:outer membrane receptor protein involved in Fe transport